MFDVKLSPLSSYLHVDGYKIPFNYDSYTTIKPKQIDKPSSDTKGKAIKGELTALTHGQVENSICVAIMKRGPRSAGQPCLAKG